MALLIHVSYSPSSSCRMTNRAGREYVSRRPARFLLLERAWIAAATWTKGDAKPPEWSFRVGEPDAPPLPEPASRLVVEREHVVH